MPKIELLIECPACSSTGVYQGVGETLDTAVVCNKCNGTGAFMQTYEYTLFTERKKHERVKRVYKSGYGYKIGLGVISFEGNKINMDNEGVSYKEFLDGKLPGHIEKLVCPMLADQDTCHKIKGFVDTCHALNGGWVGLISKCKKQPDKAECWKRFKKEN